MPSPVCGGDAMAGVSAALRRRLRSGITPQRHPEQAVVRPTPLVHQPSVLVVLPSSTGKPSVWRVHAVESDTVIHDIGVIDLASDRVLIATHCATKSTMERNLFFRHQVRVTCATVPPRRGLCRNCSQAGAPAGVRGRCILANRPVPCHFTKFTHMTISTGRYDTCTAQLLQLEA